MSQSRVVLPAGPDPGALSAWTYSDPNVSMLYRAALGNRLAEVVGYSIMGGKPPDLDYAPLRFLVPDFDQTGQTAKLLESAQGWFYASGLRPPAGEDLRAFQIVTNGRKREARCNLGVRGSLWGSLKPATSASQLAVQVGFSLPDDEPEDAMHVTVFRGELGDQRSALVFSDLFPSALRRQTPAALARMIGSGLPRRARDRWRGLMAEANRLDELNEVRSLIWLSYRRRREFLGDTKGAMRRGIATDVLEALERSVGCGLPSRRTESIEVVGIDSLPDSLAKKVLQVPGGPADGAKLDEILPVLDARSREVLRLRYEEDWTEEQIAQHFELSQPMVHKIERQALDAVSRAIGPTPS